jgi:arginine-tRNA-protein transferase
VTKRHKRLLNKTAHLTWKWKSTLDPNWFELYEKYITKRHKNGSMYPPNSNDFLQFCQSTTVQLHYLHAYDEDKLIAVAVTDEYDTGYSAFYTFFDPESPFSLGTRCILEQINTAQKNHKLWVYLGFQVDDCPAMRYKRDYLPHQRFKNSQWHSSPPQPIKGI